MQKAIDTALEKGSTHKLQSTTVVHKFDGAQRQLVEAAEQAIHVETESKKADAIIDAYTVQIPDSPGIHIDVSWEKFHVAALEYAANKKREGDGKLVDHIAEDPLFGLSTQERVSQSDDATQIILK